MHPLVARLPDCIFASITLLLVSSAIALTTIPAADAVTGAAEPALAVTPSVVIRRPAAAINEPEAPPPRRIRIDHLGIDSSLTPLSVQADGSLEVPSDYAQAGWHRAGTAPGNTGPAVIVGHVDSEDGPAVFFRLRELAPGDRLSVSRVDGSEVIFEIYGLERYAKDAFPTESVYGPTAVPELRLVTCGGAFNKQIRSYQDNVVAYARVATPIPPGPAPPAEPVAPQAAP